ncbi:hypothetical protein BST61_g6677 [Cercospora zeina]
MKKRKKKKRKKRKKKKMVMKKMKAEAGLGMRVQRLAEPWVIDSPTTDRRRPRPRTAKKSNNSRLLWNLLVQD